MAQRQLLPRAQQRLIQPQPGFHTDHQKIDGVRHSQPDLFPAVPNHFGEHEVGSHECHRGRPTIQNVVLLGMKLPPITAASGPSRRMAK